MQNYKTLIVWRKSHEFTKMICEITNHFPRTEIFSLTAQIKRSAISIPANIAEGCGRMTKNEMAHYLNISLGSANETEYYLILAKDLNYIPLEKQIILLNLINEIKAMLIILIKKIRFE